MAPSVEFTTNEEFSELRDNDLTTELFGYVVEVTAPAEVGKKEKYMLFKFILSNGDKRITCLIWGKELIQKYVQSVVVNRIVHIEGGHCKSVSSTYFKNKNDLVPFEVIIRENSVVEFHEMIDFMSRSLDDIVEVDFETIETVDTTKMISLGGYIKTVFAVTHARDRNSAYAIGAITNGTKKLTIQVVNYSQNTLTKGDFIVVTGRIREDDELPIIYCNSMDDIELKSEIPKMPPNELRAGVRTPKRRRAPE